MICFKKHKLKLNCHPSYVRTSEGYTTVRYIELIRYGESNSFIGVIFPGKDFSNETFTEAIASFQKEYKNPLTEDQILKIEQWSIKNNVCDFYPYLPEQEIISRKQLLTPTINKILKL